jgi:hypothetical protein
LLSVTVEYMQIEYVQISVLGYKGGAFAELVQ